MKVLILTCNTGEGHNSVAEAVRQVFSAAGTACDVTDALSFMSERASEAIAGVHTSIYRYMPGAFRWSYQFMEQHPSVLEEDGFVAKMLTTGAERMREYILAEGYDCLICPHAFAALIVTQMRRMYPDVCSVPVSFIATDHTCSPTVMDCDMDWFFAPSAGAAEEFLAAGIPAERVVTTAGIPVRREFFRHVDRSEARRRLGLPQTGQMLLAMCGSMGCGHLDALAELVADRLSPGQLMTVVCGTNVRLRRKLERIFADRKDVHILGYCDDVALLMDCADLYLTKPGGISTAEAAVKGLPMVLVDAVAGCEEYNLRYFCQRGGAVTADRQEDLARLCLSLLDDPAALRRMGAAIRQRGDAAAEICSCLSRKETVA